MANDIFIINIKGMAQEIESGIDCIAANAVGKLSMIANAYFHLLNFITP